ncbi:hypothetical protein DFH28DRAFT_1120665 [Melampsora americana]|nr:hypothetical protein DFH28DRAFT_1120665 [Melampsora americana]
MLFPRREPFTPRTDDSFEVNWLGSSFDTGFSPRRFLTYRNLLDSVDDRAVAKAQQRTDGANRNDSTPDRPRRSKRHAVVHNLSPRAQREMERVAEYNRKRESKNAIRRIIKIIQNKRREEFRVLREALRQVYHYTGPYLQKPGEKAVAAQLIRAGGLGAEFVDAFDDRAKWHWLQIRVNGF